MITLDGFKEKDLCFNYDDQLYDYDTLEDFYEEMYELIIDNYDPVEFDNDVQIMLEKVKNIKVYTKEYFKIPIRRIKADIDDFIENNWEDEMVDIEVYYSVKAEEYLQKFLIEVEEVNKMWRPIKKMGYIDLSKEVEKYIREEYGYNE
jgi:hypothetical protein